MADSQPDKLKEKLIAKCSTYIGSQELEKIKHAISIAEKSHLGQKRISGTDFIVHPLRVALRLANIKMDADVISAAILHDTLEDTNLDPAQIKRKIGSDVLDLVKSLTKLSKVQISKNWFPFSRVQETQLPEFERQVENLRRMLVAISNDARVVVIKLADKIDNMETLSFLPKEKQEKIAREVLEIYAPIAQRLGIGEWKGMLEDLAFPYLYPKEYEYIKKLSIPKVKDREQYLKKVSKKVKRILKQNSIDAQIDFRAKRLYSLYRKLEKYDNDMSKIYDLVAMRITVNDVEECYKTLGIIHGLWKPLFSRIKDFISLPKPNGYQSIHTTVFCDEGQIVEFQIRTFKMHYQAEFGIASHWIYESKKLSRLPNKSELQWLKDFFRMQKNISSPQELEGTFKRDYFKNRIFVFTPKGDVKDLPFDATPVDFAYAIHSGIGNRCAGAKVNGKIAPLDSQLENGDIVEILIKKSAKPRADWLNFAKTHLARSNIRRNLKGL